MTHKAGGTGPRIVFAVYKPHEGGDVALRKLMAEHVPILRRLQLATDRTPIHVRSRNGAYVEVFEWVSDEAAERAHDHPEVARIWEAMGKVADTKDLASLPEAANQFSHYEPVAL
ncbi:MAG: hypothetical protein WAW96_18790 [Alphaproteobacteria bacterium]